MQVVAHGIDMVDCRRLAQAVRRHGQRFLKRIYTPAELDYCLGRKRQLEHLAGRFAAKEAVLKVLGTGLVQGMRWTDIEVTNAPSGQPEVTLSGRVRAVAEEKGIRRILISITHIETHAIASAVATDA